MRKPLTDYLALHYPFKVVAEPEGGYFIEFPDLPGCMTQVQRADEIGPLAEEIRTLWIETEYEHGAEIPLPSTPVEYSGKFVLRLPKSLHRTLAQTAELNGISLNQYITLLLDRGHTLAMVQRQLDRLEHRIEVMQDSLRHSLSDVSMRVQAGDDLPDLRRSCAGKSAPQVKAVTPSRSCPSKTVRAARQRAMCEDTRSIPPVRTDPKRSPIF